MKNLPTIDELNAELEQPEKLPTIDELNAGLEQQNQLPTIDELNAELGLPTKLPTIEELNAEIEQQPKPPTQEQPTAAQENPAAEPEKKPVVGLNEMAGLSYEAQTGVDAPENAVGKHIVNVFGFAGKNLANAQMNAAQTLVDGSERSDDDTNRALSRMLYGDIGGTVASWFSVPDVLEEWDAGEGQRYTDKGERTKARNAFASGIAKQFIADRTRTQQDAQKELQTREKTFGAETMSDLENTAGYMVPFAMGPLGIAAQFLTGAIGNAEGLANDEYGFDDDGNLIVTAKGDDANTAAAKGIMSSAIETGAEVIGGKLAGKVVGGLGKKLAEMTVGKFPIVEEVAGKLVATPIGQTVAKAATALNRFKGWASRKLHIDGLGEEYIEEWLDPTLNAVMGSDTRDAEQIPDPGTRVWEAQKDFFTVDNQQRLIASLVILQGAGNFVAYCAERKRMNVVDDYLRKNGLMTDEEISEKSPDEKAQAMNEYVASLSEGKLAEILNQTAEMADGAAASIADEVTKPKEFTPEQNIALDETIPQFVGASEPLFQRVKERIREKLTTGQLGGAQASGVVDQLDDPKQREDLVMGTVEEILHEDNMAEIDKTVNVKTVGFGWQEISGKLDEAMPRTADTVTSGFAGLIAAANPQMDAERVWEIAGYMAVHEGTANQDGQPMTKERIAEVEKQMSEDGAGIVPVEQEDGSFKTVNELEAEAEKVQPETPENQEQQPEEGDKSLQWAAVPGKDNVWHAPLFPEVKITIQDEDGGKAMLVDGLPDPKTLDDDKRTELGRFLQDLLDKANRNGIQDVDLGEDPSVLDGYGQVLDDYRTKVQDEKFQKRAEGVLGILEKSGLAAGVVTDQETFDKKLAEQGGQQLVADGLTYGWTDGQNVYLNPKFFGTRSGLNTPIHEFGHLAIIATKKINRPLYDKGIELIKKTHYWSEVSRARDYRGDSEEKRAEEALTRMIADRGELLDANTPKSVVAEIKQWLVELWKSFGKSLGIRDLTPEMVEKMSVEDIADAIRAEMSSGREFGTRDLSLQEGDLKAKILRFAKYSKPTSRGAKDALEAAKKAWKGLSEEQKVALGQYGDTDVLKTQEARTIANGVRMLREWDARRARISQAVKEQIMKSPNEGQKKIITGSPQYYVSQVTGDVTSPFAFAIDRGLPIPRKGDWGWDAWERLTDGMKYPEKRELMRILGGEHPKRGGMDTVLSDYAQWLGISWGDGARDFEHGRGIEDFLDDILKERAKFEQWKAGDRKTREENEADAAAAQERRDGMTDEEFAEEDAWVRASEARRVEAERMDEQDDLSDMPDFKRPIRSRADGTSAALSSENGNGIMLSRGGMARFVAGRARVADDAGHGEQTPGGLAASHELSAQTPTPISQAGRILPMSLPVSEMLQLYKRITGDALPVHVARRMPLGKYSGHTMEGKIIIHSDVFGTVDRTDEEKEKTTLKAHGFFRNEDPRWCMGQSNAAIKAERIRSERQLATQLVNLGDRRVRGIEDGGQAAARGVFAHELAKVVMAMPRTGTGVIGRVQRIGDGVRGEINAMVAASGGNAAGAEALMRGEAGQFLDWAYGGPLVDPATGATVSRGQGQSLKELTDEMFGAFLTMPQQMQGRAQAWYDAILKTIANTPKLADAFRELSVRGVTTQAHSHVLEAIKKSHSLETERRLQQIRSEINEPISAGDLKKELKEKAVTGFHDKLGIVNLRIDWKIKEYKRAQDEIIKQMKAQGAPKSAIAAVQMQIDLFTQGMNDKLNRLELSRTAWERGAANEGMRYVIRMHNLEQKASESWGLSEDDRITYLDMMRVVETQGRAGTRGISGRQASLILGDMARRLGPEKWMRMQQYGREFHAIIEQEFLNQQSVVRMVDQGLLDYMRTQTSYIATKRVQSPEELDAIDQARANAAAAGVNGGDDVISQMYAYMGKNGGSRIGGEGLWNAKLVGSFADKQEVRSATWEKHEILMQIARKNQFIIDMRDALLAAEVKGVRDIPRHIEDVPNGERYGMLPYMENGKKRTLIVPKQITDAFKHEDNKAIRFLMKANEFFRKLYIDWNLGYAPIDMARNLGSIQKNMEGMHESPVKTALRPVAPVFTYLGDVVSTELAAHSKGMEKLAATIPGWKGTTLPFAYEAHKIVNYILHPDEWQRQVSEAEARGDIEEAARLYQTQNKALEVLSANMFVSFRARTTGKATEGFANDFMNRHGLAKIDKINSSTKKSIYRRAVESKWNLIAKNRRRIEYNDMFAKTMAYLHDRENYAMQRDVRESGVEVKKSVGLGEVERRGYNSNFIQVTVNQFFNAVEKGIAQHARAIARRPVGTLTKDGLALGGLFIAGLAKCGVLQKMILSMFGDDEEKIKGSEVEGIYNHLKDYNRAYLNCSAYTRENYNIYPLWNSPDGYTSIVLAMPQDDQEKLFGWLADYCAQTVALENGIPVSRDNFFHAFGKALVKQLAPDVSLTTGFWDIAKLALSLFDENPPEDSFRNAPIIDRDTWNMRFESLPDGANFARAAGKYLWNAGGFRSIYKFPYNEVDNGNGDAPKWIGLSTQRIPLISSALERFVKIQVGSPERDAKPIADEMKRMRTVIGHCVKELTRESARHERGLNSAAPARYAELLTTWQGRYGLSDRAMREIEKRFLNGWRELEHADDFERKRIMRLIRNGSRLGLEEAQKYMMQGEL